MRIDPWASTQYADYRRLREEFGIGEFDPSALPSPSHLFRRGVVFGQRGFSSVQRAISENRPFVLLTGLAPSGRMHLGHKMVIDEVKYYQGLGADVFIAVADIEAYAVRGRPLKEGERVAIEEYLLNYIALGLKPDRCQVYFQSKRNAVKDLAWKLAPKVNLSEMRAIYGFEDSTNMGHLWTPLIQVGDILHVQLEEYGGPRPTIVPVGVDQDPHIRLTRDLASRHRLISARLTSDGRVGAFVRVDRDVESLLDDAQAAFEEMGFREFEKIPSYKALYVKDAGAEDVEKMDEALSRVDLEHGGFGFYPPAATFHRFMTGLDGGKMSSSNPQSCIFLTDTPDEAKRKIMRAKTGGQQTVEEQREKGGDPSSCTVYELFVYHLIDSDEELEEIYNRCKNGEQLCGHCKKLAAEKMNEMLLDIAEKREGARDMVDEYVVVP